MGTTIVVSGGFLSRCGWNATVEARGPDYWWPTISRYDNDLRLGKFRKDLIDKNRIHRQMNRAKNSKFSRKLSLPAQRQSNLGNLHEFLQYVLQTALWEPSEEIYSNITSLKPRAGNIVPQYPEIKDKIKLLNFREQRVLIQFWSPHVVGKQQFLTTVDQPFGLDLFCIGGTQSAIHFLWIRIMKKRRGLPEWTPDLINYTPEDFPLQQSAICCNLKGYLALPVFDSTTSLCVGVLELSTSSKYMSYAYEVQNIHEAFKTVNLRTPQVFDWSTSNIPNERRQIRMDKIHTYLKVICEKYGLPLAQTWAMSPFGSYVPHAKGLDKNCSSFNTRCIGKACMSTSGLPFFVRDLGMWHFREACRERHLEKCGGFVWRVFLSHGSCFCGDVSELSEEEYPLVHNARMSGLTSCFTIDEYVLEFFLIKDDRYVSTLEETIKVTSGFELGDVSSIEIFRPGGIKKLCLDKCS